MIEKIEAAAFGENSVEKAQILVRNRENLDAYIRAAISARTILTGEMSYILDEKKTEYINKKAFAKLYRIQKTLAKNGKAISLEALQEQVKNSDPFLTYLVLDKTSEKAWWARFLKQNGQIALALATGIGGTLLLNAVYKAQDDPARKEEKRVHVTVESLLELFKENGASLTKNKDGSVTITINPAPKTFLPIPPLLLPGQDKGSSASPKQPLDQPDQTLKDDAVLAPFVPVLKFSNPESNPKATP